MNFEELKSRDVKDLRKLAAQYSIKTHPKHKAETIAKMIVEHITAKPHGQELKHVAEASKSPMVVHSEDDVRQAIGVYAKRDGFTAEFPGDDTWIFKCKGAEESGHMSAALRVIRMKAESVSVGARKPRMINLGDGPVMAVG